MMINEKTVQIGNHRLFYRTAGNGNEVVVLMHGIPTNSYLWIQVIPQLAANNYTVIAPDLLGYGKSGRASADQLTLPKQAQYILGILDHLGVKKAHFVGHDLGGGIAQILAVHYPDRVSSFVVTDGVCFSNWPLNRVVSLRYPTAPEFEPSPFFIERTIREGLYYQQLATPDWISAFVEPFNHPTGPQELQTAAFALEHHQTQELVPHLPNVRVNATFLWGQSDRFLSPYWGYRLNETIPNSVFRIIPQAGHFCMIDNLLLFTEELLQHLQRSVAAGRVPQYQYT